MYFEKGHLFHIYNQGNNRQKIFLRYENYFFFLEKIGIHILPFADILAYCLMPNHFHLMVYYRGGETHGVTQSTHGVTQSHPVSNGLPAKSLNDSIGIMLRSYTRAINKQEQRTGGLFREATKAICLTKPDDQFANWYKSQGITTISDAQPEKQYPNICFNYILNNPVKHGLVLNPWEWEFSSYGATVKLKEDFLTNNSRIEELGLSIFSNYY